MFSSENSLFPKSVNKLESSLEGSENFPTVMVLGGHVPFKPSRQTLEPHLVLTYVSQ